MTRLYKSLEREARERWLALPRTLDYWGRRYDVPEVVDPYGASVVWNWGVEESGEGCIDSVSKRKMLAVMKALVKVRKQKVSVL